MELKQNYRKELHKLLDEMLDKEETLGVMTDCYYDRDSEQIKVYGYRIKLEEINYFN